MSSKPISVKVPKAKLVESLTKALNNRKAVLAEYDKAVAEHDKAVKEWEKKVIDLIASGKMKPKGVTYSNGWRNEQPEINAVFTASVAYPKSPEAPASKWQMEAEIEELENALAILNMTEEEMVGTSTYKGVARLIK